MYNLLSEKASVVTGGASGIGRAIAKRFAEEGSDVIIADIQKSPESDGRPTHEWINSETESNSDYIQCNVSDKSDLEFAVKSADQFGGIDIMVNNAGFGGAEEFLNTSEEDYERMMGVNAKGVFFGSQAAANQMITQNEGCIINIASTSAHRGSANSVTYSASKGAVRMMTYAIANQLGDEGIRANVISPGTTKTNFRNETYGSEVEKKSRYNDVAVPLSRSAEPEEIANAAVFLASDLASYVSGHALLVDGGITTAKTDVLSLFNS